MKSIVVEGQISLFDEQPKKVNVFTPKEDKNIFNDLIKKYKNNCSRIVKVENKLYVEIENHTLSFKPDGEVADVFVKDMVLRPKDEILVANEYKPITELQIKALNKFTDIDKVIKRKSDNNILIQYDNFCISIYPSGHFAKWKSPAAYKEDDVYNIDEIQNINKMHGEVIENVGMEVKTEEVIKEEVLKVGDKVRFDYHGLQEGKITRIYNKGETVNVTWDNKCTAFYYKNVEKIYA